MTRRTTIRNVVEANPAPFSRGLRRRSAHVQHDPVTAYDTVAQLLRDILRSACDVLNAEQAFFAVSRGTSLLEVAAAHNIHPTDVVDAILGPVARPVRAAMREGIMAAGDWDGAAVPLCDGFFESNAPAVLCVPLELGPRQSGALCLLRRAPRRMSDLDLEIVQALAEQAALAIGAASHSSALSRLTASLGSAASAAPVRA